MAADTNEIEIAVGKAKKKPGFLGGGSDSEKDESDTDTSDDSESASDDEVAALKEFDKASSPETRASALKLFIKLCTEGY